VLDTVLQTLYRTSHSSLHPHRPLRWNTHGRRCGKRGVAGTHRAGGMRELTGQR
jgi:hypothetical protein